MVVLVTSEEHVLGVKILSTEPESLETVRLQKVVQLGNQISLLGRRELVTHVNFRQEVLEPTDRGDNLINLLQNSLGEKGTLGRDENDLGGGLLLVQGLDLLEEVGDSAVEEVQSGRELGGIDTVLGADGADTIESERKGIGVVVLDESSEIAGQGVGGLAEEEELNKDPEVLLRVQIESDGVNFGGAGRDEELHVLGVHSEGDALAN